MHQRGTVALVTLTLLCLPCIVAGAALLFNFVGQHPIEKWGLGSAVPIALAVFFGGPLVFVATVVGGYNLLSPRVSRPIKIADATILALGAASTWAVWLRFRMY